MTRTFIQTSEFVKNWEKLGLNDNDLRRLEIDILKNPKVGKRILLCWNEIILKRQSKY